MKRFLALVLLVCICVSMAGCKVLDYKDAMELYEAGQYAQALEIYRALGDFADSATMAEICWQKADYLTAESLYAAGNYEQALPVYEGLGMYSDSPLKAIRCRYEIGMALLAAEDYVAAMEWLIPLGNYENSADQVHLARWQWLSESRYTTVLMDEADSFRAFSLEPQTDDTLRILLENDSMLLGLPYETEFTMVLERNSSTAAYTVYYRSVGDTTVEESVTGVAELPALAAGGALQVGAFVQTITDPEGAQVISENAADALMIRIVMEDAVKTVMETLPTLLESTGVDITMEHLGF